MKVLVAHNTRAMRMIVIRALHQMEEVDGVEQAESAEVALEYALETAFDLVLSDWNFAGQAKTGIDLLEALRAAGSSIRFGFITAETSASIRQRALDAGAEFVLNKPFSVVDLAEVIRGREEVPAAADVAGAPTTPAPDEDPCSRPCELETLLSALCETPVRVVDSRVGPDAHVPRYIATYLDEAEEISALCEFDVRGAGALAGAMIRWAPKITEQWVRTGTLPTDLFDNLLEVANVLARFVRADGSRVVLRRVEGFAPGEPFRDRDRRGAGRVEHFVVEVEGHGGGLCSVVAF